MFCNVCSARFGNARSDADAYCGIHCMPCPLQTLLKDSKIMRYGKTASAILAHRVHDFYGICILGRTTVYVA